MNQVFGGLVATSIICQINNNQLLHYVQLLYSQTLEACRPNILKYGPNESSNNIAPGNSRGRFSWQESQTCLWY